MLVEMTDSSRRERVVVELLTELMLLYGEGSGVTQHLPPDGIGIRNIMESVDKGASNLVREDRGRGGDSNMEGYR